MPTPYVVGRFNAVAHRENLNFEAWFNERLELDRSWNVNETEWRFRARYIPEHSVFGRRLRLPVAELRDTQPQVFVSLHASMSFALGTLAARAEGARTAFRILPTYDTWVRRAKWKELLKNFLFRTVDGVKVPGPDGEKMARRYGVPGDRIHIVTQSVDVEHYSRALAIEPAVRMCRRKQFGLHGCVFLYVGRLWSGKGLDYLLKAYASVRQQQPDVSLLIVGDGVDEARYRSMSLNLPSVTFTGFVQPSDLPAYYALADVLIFPTLGDPYGLVVEEAMAAGLPVICTENAGDIPLRLPEGRAGYIIPPADAVRLAERMLRLADDPKLRLSFSSEARRVVVDRTHERWASDFEMFVDQLLSMPPRRTLVSLVARAVGACILVAGGKAGRLPAPLIGLGGGTVA